MGRDRLGERMIEKALGRFVHRHASVGVRDIADACGLHFVTVSRWISGRSRPRAGRWRDGAVMALVYLSRRVGDWHLDVLPILIQACDIHHPRIVSRFTMRRVRDGVGVRLRLRREAGRLSLRPVGRWRNRYRAVPPGRSDAVSDAVLYRQDGAVLHIEREPAGKVFRFDMVAEGADG